jgi:hypothetical protein
MLMAIAQRRRRRTPSYQNQRTSTDLCDRVRNPFMMTLFDATLASQGIPSFFSFFSFNSFASF